MGGSAPGGTATAIGGFDCGVGAGGAGSGANCGLFCAFCASGDNGNLYCVNESGVNDNVSSVGNFGKGCASGGLGGRPEGRNISL